MRRLRSWLVNLLLRDDLAELQREIEEEFHFHKEMKAKALVAKGMDPEAARVLAEECFGDTQALLRDGVRNLSGAKRKEERRNRVAWLGQDLKDGFRRLARNPGFSFLAIGTLALGLSTSAAVFTYVNAYHQSFPGADAGDSYQLFLDSEQGRYGALSYPDYQDLVEAGASLFETMGIYGGGGFAASARFETLTEVIRGQAMTGSFFSVLGVEMGLGRGISPEDDGVGAPAVAVISHNYWQRRYGGDSGVLGSTLFLNDEPYSIVGVTSSSFLGSVSAFRPDFWLSFRTFAKAYWPSTGVEADREVGTIVPYLRLRAGVEMGAVEEFLAGFAANLDDVAPLEDRTRRFSLEPARWIQPAVRVSELPATRIMFVAAATLLLLACANVANLFLSAGTRRRQEIALRSAMGASRLRLIRQLLAENVLLSLLAGGIALVAAGPAAQRLSSYFARPSVWGFYAPRVISVDFRVLAFGVLVAIAVGVLTGIFPALSASARNPAAALKMGGERGSERSSFLRFPRWGVRDFLVAGQVALSVVLLVLAALVLRTLDSARRVDPGFDAEWTLASYVSTSSMGIPRSERAAFFQELATRLEELPWVRAVAVAEDAPLSAHPVQDVRIPELEEGIPSVISRVVPGFFEALGIETVVGRTLRDEDAVPGPTVAVVNEAMAAHLGGGTDAIGKTIHLVDRVPEVDGDYEVVGVVEDIRLNAFPDESGPVAYFPLPPDRYYPGNAVLLKVTGDPWNAMRQMEDELRAVDPRLAIVNIAPYPDIVEGFLYARRMNAELFSVIALLGLLLSAAGVFGIMSLSVARQRREIGIRIAIGADRWDIVRLVGVRAALTVALGLAVGLAVALAGARLVEGLLWGVQPADPVSLLVGIVVLIMAAFASAAIPIGRALRAEPVHTLLPD